MSVRSTGRRPGTAVGRLSPEDAHSVPRWPSPGGSVPAAHRRPGRPQLRLVPPLPAGPAEDGPAAPPRGQAAAAQIQAAAGVRLARPGHVSARTVRPAGAPAGRPPARSRVRLSRPAGAPAGRRPRSRVRLTRRGRVVVWVLAALVAAAVLTPVWLIAATGAQAANHGLPAAAVHAGMRHVVVRPGQTLWSIAMAAAPAADPRVVTQEIMRVNALSSQVLVPGESLWVPAS